MLREIKKFGGSLAIIIGKYECQLQDLKQGEMIEVKIKKIKEEKKHGKR